MNNFENNNFELMVQLYEELIPYKDFFDCAIHYVHREFSTSENLFSIDFAPGENSKRKSARIKITNKSIYYKELYEEIKNISNSKSDRAVVNNLLSALVGVEQFTPKNY
jgi:hypothetical protein